ncbi:response regulator transcription factor [Nitrosomonas sp.]|uniref:response regulator transcription factor n=1 Tax=Nitrosomonas sp. TaxID=42353 RepID=UPI002080FB4A|nr:response regulator transcription factor [Nitrosomonas sp.]GJL76870.1 MAG: DNA-binding response regulator [Nitrosomonas sp.]
MNDFSILLIEDEKALRENIAEIIAHYGYHIISAPTGEEGVKKALQFMPDIIVCDIMLPGIDGYDVFTQVKQIPQLLSTAFIFLTAKSTRADTRTGMNMGADDYLTKPFTKEELINSIKARVEKLTQIRKNRTEKDTLIEPALEKMAGLTKTERRVLNKISEGFTTPQIAQKLFVSKKTIENHRVNISRKLNLSGPNSLISFALRLKTQQSDNQPQDNLSSTPPN